MWNDSKNTEFQHEKDQLIGKKKDEENERNKRKRFSFSPGAQMGGASIFFKMKLCEQSQKGGGAYEKRLK